MFPTTRPFPQSPPTTHLENPCPSLEVLAITPLPLGQLPLAQLGTPSLSHSSELQASGSDTAPIPIPSGGGPFLNSPNPGWLCRAGQHCVMGRGRLHPHRWSPLLLGTEVRRGQSPHSHGLHEVTDSPSSLLWRARSQLSHAGSLCPRPPDVQGETPPQAQVSPAPHGRMCPLVPRLALRPLLGNPRGRCRGLPAG